MTSTQGRRPDGPGAYLYGGIQPVLVDEVDGELEAAFWIRVSTTDGELVGIDAEPVDQMPQDFVPLTKPVAAPEPSWDDAPEWATGHQYGASGDGIWTAPGRSELSGMRLPLGVDWRTTLRKRPEVQGE